MKPETEGRMQEKKKEKQAIIDEKKFLLLTSGIRHLLL